MSRRVESLLLLGLAALLLLAYGLTTRHGPALADEFIYLAGARYFGETGGLEARYYDADAILQIGHPHHDVHTPGYVILLGALTAVVKGGYRTAVALNAAAYAASAFLVRALARALGAGRGPAFTAAAAFLVLPATLAYTFWAMPELLLTVRFLASLVVAARWGDRTAGAAGAALLFGLAVLVRESALIAVPAPLALLWGRGRGRVFLAATLAFMALVYAPLSRHRAPGGANFWVPSSGRAFGYQAVQAARGGRILQAASLVTARARANVDDLVYRTGWTERGILLVYAALPLVAAARWKGMGWEQRRFLPGLGLSFTALLVFVYVLAQWSGFRYLMFLMPAFLPWLAGPGPRGWITAAMVAVAGLLLVAGTWRTFTDYKVSRQRRQQGLTEYVERHVRVRPRAFDRIVLPNGWLFGLEHHPVEVISSLPSGGGGRLRALEQAVGFGVLVLPADSPLTGEMEGRLRYRLLNGADTDRPFHVYQRLR